MREVKNKYGKLSIKKYEMIKNQFEITCLKLLNTLQLNHYQTVFLIIKIMNTFETSSYLLN